MGRFLLGSGKKPRIIKNDDHRTMRQLLEALVVLEAKEGWADICETQYEKNPDDPKAEAAFEEAYQDEMDAFNNARDLLIKLGVNRSLAGTVLRAKRDDVKRIMKQWRKERGSPAEYWKKYSVHY